MIKQVCAICEKNNYTVLYPENFDIAKINSRIFSARRLPDRIHYRIVKCKNCNLVYSTPILEYAKIEKLYKKSFTSYDEHLENLQETYGYYLRELNKFRNSKLETRNNFQKPKIKNSKRFENLKFKNSNLFRISDLGFRISQPMTLLEIGCGNGFFLKEAYRQGFDVYGVEPGKSSVAKAKPVIRKKIIVDIFKPGQFEKNFFDVICCFQTFDHIPNPNTMLDESYKILKKDGLMLFFNHDAGAWQNKLLGEKSPIIDIEHTYLFDKQTMRQIFEKHKFKVRDVKSSFNVHRLSYWLHLFPIPGPIKIPLIKLLDFTGLGKIKIKMYPGNLTLFAQK
ncbi:hypothetical protein A2774_04930 [Candidatus Roizmanbacteria bacterium RIFCSPHIGHO2_01_FULL_39_12c]|uniref:Methyltransferase type 11 domain-containing protein n=1 Tax=Candidatus Roizmanbacteria bacterium RIFCSPHIGHO2_01_FULL_39_12c TaxID=1802031 RepID=A0A1F7GB97_9BACT|nr:MAG: hypothetical protein A2774_04930 [Candidatus Roizmanbacteria bacterium RIFCSPHIGHO2_01_FULL_39_12c]